MKRALLWTLFLGLFLDASAQYRLDWGIHVGASNYLGDIGGKDQPRRDFISDVRLDQTRYVFGGHLRYKVSRSWSATAQVMYGQVQGWDNETEYGPRRARNLNFKNNMLEFSLRGEYTFYSDNDLGGRGYYNPEFKVYGFLGAGALMHNPQGYVTAENATDNVAEGWYDLRELRTEGQESEYSKYAFVVPAGIGVYFTHLKKYRFGWELGYRFSSTDYLDDISGFYAREEDLDSELARVLANQTTPEIIAENFDSELALLSYEYAEDYTGPANNIRGVATNNDGYIFTTISVGMLIQQKSRYSRAKYSWFNQRKRKRKSRAKF